MNDERTCHNCRRCRVIFNGEYRCCAKSRYFRWYFFKFGEAGAKTCGGFIARKKTCRKCKNYKKIACPNSAECFFNER